MPRAPFLVWLSAGIVFLPAVVGAQISSTRPHANIVSEDPAPLPYQVHIGPTSLPVGSTSIETGSDSWTARGYDLRSLVAQIFNVDARRIDFPDAMASQRFDISVSLPVDVDEDTMQRLLVDAVEKQFGLHIAAESRAMDVYVLSAPNGPGEAMKRHVTKISAAEIAGFGGADDADDDLGKITVSGQDCKDKGSNIGIDVEASTIADFRRTLEPDLDRVLVDETHLTGSFDFKVGNYTSQQQLFQLLHDQLGLVVTPAERSITVLAVRPAADQTQNLSAKL